MKIRLLLDCEGPNPAFKPPDPRVDLAAWMTYKHRVPQSIIVPAGTELDDPWGWLHCLPTTTGLIRAEPIDDDARLMVAGEYKTLSTRDKMIFDAHQRMLDARPKPEPIAETVSESPEESTDA